ncbi:TraR/DksA family transcriptional regulator [Polyangium sp. 6x1]|uniref:TraR/DksA family transcriptional regulator n=1 Tax=Polyangium sp. 6x1 TaxID=3042689 RepID=UPI002482D458|nr:TraR/DksA family transcriptional regulator [Polyangium sp. 6x1]MDI1446175.1 TraR/DksA family transcriptional regulator [Polyangium sp. 6x1]
MTRAGALNPESNDEQPELTQEQREELRGLLDARRAEILASIETRQEQERDTGREVGDEMDEANIEGATAMASRLLERDVQLLSEIDRALAKFNDGTYGLCEGTGEPIGFPRLRSRPWARFSVEYQEQLEREARTRGGI